MKIAFFHELHAGGARRSANEFGKRLKENHQVDLYIVDEKENSKERKNFSHVYFYRFLPKPWKGKDWKVRLYKDTVELLRLYKLHTQIAFDIKKRKYDVVFIQPSRFTQAPFLLRLLKNEHTVYYCQEPLRIAYEKELGIPKDLDKYRAVYEKLNRRMRKRIDKRNIHSARIVVANSKYTKRNIKNAYGINAKVSYMGVDTTVFKPMNIKKDIDILFVGAYEKVDGYPLLAKTLPMLSIAPQVFVLASEKKWINNDFDLCTLYNRAKIALCLAINEPFGLIPLEAMSCGVPVIAVDEGGYKESVIPKKTGHLIERNEAALKKILMTLLSDEKKISQLAKNSRDYIEKNWTWEKATHSLESILREAMHETSH